jgi:hypothetical protein
VFVAMLVVAAGCGGSTESAEEPSGQATAASTDSTPSDTTSDAPPLVGRWERVNECPQLVKALNQAGLGAIAPSVAGEYFPEASPKQLARKDDLCKGAEPFVHSHFFDDAGMFGSLDENLEQVDDGIYEIVDDGRIHIGPNPDVGVVFRYEVDGDALSLSPVLTPALKKQALEHPLEFSPAGWGWPSVTRVMNGSGLTATAGAESGSRNPRVTPTAAKLEVRGSAELS